MTDLQIRGGAGPYEAAAVVAVIDEMLRREELSRSKAPTRPVPAAWVRTGMPVPFGRFNPEVTPE